MMSENFRLHAHMNCEQIESGLMRSDSKTNLFDLLYEEIQSGF